MTPAATALSGKLIRVTADRGNWFAGVIETETGEKLSINGGCPAGIPQIGSTLELTGKTTRHAVYGDQFRFDSILATPPADASGSLRFLADLPGFGPVAAKKIVEALGPSAARIVSSDPETLAGVHGLTRRQIAAATAFLTERSGANAVVALLSDFGFGPGIQRRVMEHFEGRDVQSIVKRNPYALVDVDRVSFRMIDDAVIRLRLLPIDSPFRAAAACVQTLKDIADMEGGTCWPEPLIGDKVGRLKCAHAIPSDAVAAGIAKAIESNSIVRRGDMIALPSLASDEDLIAFRILEMTK